LNMRMGTTPVLAGLGSYVLFNVGKGNTTNGVDLYWNASIANGNDCNIVKGGAGTMWIPGTVGTILNSGVSDPSLLVVSNGVLLIDTGVGPADTVLVYGGRLGGGGPNSYIECNVTNFAGGTIEGGDLGTNIGALYIGGGLTLEPGTTTVARIDPDNSTFDSIIGMTNVTFGGTLTVTNIGGAWTSGQSFQLFQATTYVGNFDAFNLPPLPFGLGWSWAPTTGTLSVAGSAVPVFTAFGPLSDGSFPLTFAGESGHPYKVLTTTNLLLPLTNWTVLSTGTFGAGAVNYTNTHATNAEQFYDIQSQ